MSLELRFVGGIVPLIRFTQAPPQVGDPIPDLDLLINPEPFSFPAHNHFYGSDLTFSIVGGGQAISIEGGIVTIQTSEAISQMQVTIQAANSAGSVEQTFRFQVRLDSGSVGLQPEHWHVRQDPRPGATLGRLELWISDQAPVPQGGRLRIYSGPNPDGIANDANTRAMAVPYGTPEYTASYILPPGTYTAVIYNRDEATGEYTTLGTKTFVIGEADPGDPGTPPYFLTSGQWGATLQAGNVIRFTLAAGVALPTDYTARVYAGPNAAGVPTDAATVAIAPGGTVDVPTGMTEGIAHARVFWRHVSNDYTGAVQEPRQFDLGTGTAPVEPYTFTHAMWTAGERPGQPYGRTTATRNATPVNPEGWELRLFIGGPTPTLALGSLVQVLAPGGTINTEGSHGATEGADTVSYVHPVWHRPADGDLRIAGPARSFTWTKVQEPDPPAPGAILIASPSAAAVSGANAKPASRYGPASVTTTSHASIDAVWGGPHVVVSALASANGNTNGDAHLLACLREAIKGQYSMLAGAGAGSRPECNYVVAAAITKLLTPRIWTGMLTAAERSKIDTVVKSVMFGKAFWFSETNASKSYLDMQGGLYISRPNYNPNHRMGKVLGWTAGMVYFGGPTEATAMMQAYTHSTFRSELQSQGLTNTYNVWNNSYAQSNASHIQSCIRNFRYRGMTLAQWSTMIADEMLNATDENCSLGYNNGAGLGGTPTARCGRVVSSSGYPTQHLGQLGMFTELNSTDGGGPRVACVYAVANYDYCIMWLILMILTGYWTKSTPSVQTMLTRLIRGCDDLKFKMVVGGFRDYEKGSCSHVWPGNSTKQSDYGLSYRFALWDVVRSYLQS